MKYAFLGLAFLCNFAIADCNSDSKLLDKIIVQSDSTKRTAAQDGYRITEYQDQNYCLLLKQQANDTLLALLYNKNNETHHLIENFKKITTSPDNKMVAVFASEPYTGVPGGQHLYFFDQHGAVDIDEKIIARIDSEQYKMYFTADSKKFIIMTYDDYMDFFYYVDLSRRVLIKNESSMKVRSKVRDYGLWVTDFRVIDEDHIMVTLEDNSIRYYYKADLLWQKNLNKERKDRVIAVGNKYIVTVTADDSIYYFSRHDGTEYKIMSDQTTEFSLHERLDPNDVRWVEENKLVAVISVDGKDRVFYFDFTNKNITEKRSDD
jgi:hypothetical protein